MASLAVVFLVTCTPREEAQARRTAEKAKEATRETARELGAGARTAAEAVKEAAREVKEETGPLLDRLGDRLKRAAARLDTKTADEREVAAREARGTLDEVDRWLDDVGPKAKAGTRELTGQLRKMTKDLRGDLERLGSKTGPALDRARDDINRKVERLEKKLGEARESERAGR